MKLHKFLDFLLTWVLNLAVTVQSGSACTCYSIPGCQFVSFAYGLEGARESCKSMEPTLAMINMVVMVVFLA